MSIIELAKMLEQVWGDQPYKVCVIAARYYRGIDIEIDSYALPRIIGRGLQTPVLSVDQVAVIKARR